MKLLIIRPEPGGTATAARATAAGVEPLLLPFFEARARTWAAAGPDSFDALLLTSANAVRYAGPQLDAYRRLPVHCVGERTAEIAGEAQLNLASIGKSDAAQAVAAALDAGHRRLLWLAGEDHRPLASGIAVHIETAICYASEPVEQPPHAKDMIAQADAIALHSSRAAEAFAASVDRLGLPRSSFIIAAFSSAIADAAGKGWRAIAIAAEPNDKALLSALASLVKLQDETPLGKEQL
jgi:uroporphyrinogen-III synthase